MWDGRESAPQTGTTKVTYDTNPDDLLSNLAHQSQTAVSLHAQGLRSLTPEQMKAIVDFEMNLASAQAYDYRAGSLEAGGAFGGPKVLGTQSIDSFYIGTNDSLGGNPRGLPFTPLIFNLYDPWAEPQTRPLWRESGHQEKARMQIVRGQALFNSKPINITNVGGLNDDLNQVSIQGTCGTCHDTPNIGNHSLPVPLNIGVGDLDSPLDVSYLPVFTLENKTTHETKQTTDIGRALVTGAWKDVGKVKGPILRGLASRAPYFHNGSAQSLSDLSISITPGSRSISRSRRRRT